MWARDIAQWCCPLASTRTSVLSCVHAHAHMHWWWWGKAYVLNDPLDLNCIMYYIMLLCHPSKIVCIHIKVTADHNSVRIKLKIPITSREYSGCDERRNKSVSVVPLRCL